MDCPLRARGDGLCSLWSYVDAAQRIGKAERPARSDFYVERSNIDEQFKRDLNRAEWLVFLGVDHRKLPDQLDFADNAKRINVLFLNEERMSGVCENRESGDMASQAKATRQRLEDLFPGRIVSATYDGAPHFGATFIDVHKKAAEVDGSSQTSPRVYINHYMWGTEGQKNPRIDPLPG